MKKELYEYIIPQTVDKAYSTTVDKSKKSHNVDNSVSTYDFSH